MSSSSIEWRDVVAAVVCQAGERADMQACVAVCVAVEVHMKVQG